MQPLAGGESLPVVGAERLHPDDMSRMLGAGSRCTRFEYCVSAVLFTFRFQSPTYLTDSWQTRYLHGLSYSLVALAFGPWGVPWGPMLTLRAIWINMLGGEDLTAQVLARLAGGESGQVAASGSPRQ